MTRDKRNAFILRPAMDSVHRFLYEGVPTKRVGDSVRVNRGSDLFRAAYDQPVGAPEVRVVALRAMMDADEVRLRLWDCVVELAAVRVLIGRLLEEVCDERK